MSARTVHSIAQRAVRTAWLAAGLTGCSFLVDDAPYACGPDTECSASYAAAPKGESCTKPADCPGTAPACYAGKCLACTPHRLCSEPSSLCVPDEKSESASCKPLLDSSIDCNFTYPYDLASLAGNDLFPVGLIAQWPTEGSSSTYGVPTTQAIELAISEINKERGLPVRSQPARKLLAIVCNEARPARESSRPALARRVDHLVKDLRVAAIIGGSTSGATREINGSYLGGHDTLLLSPSATDDTLSDVFRSNASGTEQQLFWRTVAPDALQVPALKSALEVVKMALKASGNPDELEIVSVYDTNNSASKNLNNLFSQERNYLAAEYPYTSGDKASKDSVVQSIVKLAPRFIVPFGIGEFVTFKAGDEPMDSMLENIEAQWTADARPWYIMSEGNRTSFASALSRVPGLADRLIGTAPGPRSSTLYNSFRSAFQAYFRNRPGMLEGSQPSPGNLAESGYDAAYLLAYAATKASADGVWPSGSELARAIAELNCKEQPRKLEADSLRYGGQVSALSADPGGCFDFEGASGPLDYRDSAQSTQSPKAKEPSSDIALWCLGRPGDADDQTANLTRHYFQQSSAMIVPTGLAVGSQGWCAAATR